MATAYTSLLGLALPVTGELAGTWGDTVNNSITSLLDSAVSGTTTLSTDADVTLTTTTGASNQARQAILLCSGARTVLRNITAPAQSKLYVVINSTTGGFGVVIRGVGPTTGVTVANGKTAVVVWNGSDFVEVAPATATTATNLAGGVAGSLPYQTAASTTTFLGIGTANYVLTSTGTAPTWTLNTGTGSVVRATSPTLATPTFTTSATFPLHIGGTGTTDTLTLRSTSGVGTTGADIIFQTGNNGATEAMRIVNGGDVGIGTATLASIGGAYRTVTLNASGGSGFVLQAAGVTQGLVWADSTLGLVLSGTSGGTTPVTFRTNSNERMRIGSDGRVGINTTSPQALFHVSVDGNGALFSRDGAAAVVARTAFDANADGSFFIGQRARTSVAAPSIVTSGDRTIEIWGRGYDGAAYQSAGRLTIDVDAAPAAGSMPGRMVFFTTPTGTVTPVERMRITSAGNVGIGTITPGSPLTVYAGNNRATIKVTNGPSANNVGITLESTGGDVILNNGNGPFELSTGGSIRAVVTAAGNMGVGTASPSCVFEAVASPAASIPAAGAASSHAEIGAGPYGTSFGTLGSGRGYIQQQRTDGTATTYDLLLQPNGSALGVGTTSPLSAVKLHVEQNANVNYSTSFVPVTTPSQLVLRDLSDVATYTNPFAAVQFGAGSTGAGWSYIAGAREGSFTSFLAFGTGTGGHATERMRIDSAGNVGVGTTSPTSPLTIGTATSIPLLINGQTTGASYISITNTSGAYVAGVNNSAGSAIGSGLAYSSLVGTNNATALQLTTNGNARLTVDSAGLVGIGTAAPAQLLHIASGDATALIENTAATSNATLQLKYPSRTWALANRGADLSGAFAIRDVTAGADRLVINSTGNLLIGGATPIGSSRVELLGTNDATSQISLYRSDLAQRTIIGAQYIGTFTNTNFDFYTNSISRLSITSAGIINIPNLTASQAVFTDASKNLVSNAITGSGSVVMSTSPTLVTPILGTPTSGTLTSCTGLPLTTGVTGTLPVANGGTGITSLGTGVATWLGTPSSANLLAAMTDETGTGALVFATSPTLVTPTFTTSATFPLHIGGTTTTSTLTLRSTSGVGATGADIIFQVGNNGATEAMRVLNSGNVGIGTATPGYPLHLSGTTVGAVRYGVSSNTDTTAGAGAGWAAIHSGVSTVLNARSDLAVAQIGTFSNHPAAFYTNTAEAMRIDASGNLLVGTTNNSNSGSLCRSQIAYTGGGTQYGLGFRPTNDTTTPITFANASGTVVGSISQSTSTTSYNPSSDVRLKENITPITNGLERIAKLKPVDYNWKLDGSLDNGFIAQDLLAEPDFANRVNAIGKAADGSDMYGVDYMKFVAVLVAAIQELKVEIDILKGAK